MSIEKRAFKGASWLALFKFISQVFSWTCTIIVARLLMPDDYGLMAMSTIITGYAEMFGELGIGSAIIQRPNSTQNELSSVFWFSLLISLLFAISCFPFAYLTAYIFNEPRVIPLTKTVSVIFLINGLQIVPLNLLKKELSFKKVGLIEMKSIFVSCSAMIMIAYFGGGVWTLIGGRIILGATKLIHLYKSKKWFPNIYFSFEEAKKYIGFGVIVAMGSSFHYVSEKSDRFFAGRAWPPQILGLYTFALQLAQIPTEKIVTLINQVSFAVFTELQNDKKRFNDFYLNITKVTALLVFPLFVGGFMLGDELIRAILGDKWLPIIFIFKFLCLSQILTALNAVNNFVHIAQGRPQWRVFFNGTLAILMSLSFFIFVKKGLNAIIIPWFTTYFFLCVIWMILTLRKIDISIYRYCKSLSVPLIGVILMSLSIILCGNIISAFPRININEHIPLIINIAVGTIVYVGFFLIYDNDFSINVLRLLKPVPDNIKERNIQ